MLTQLFINNKWHKSQTGDRLASIDPATGNVIAHVQAAGQPDVDIAVAAAQKAFRYESSTYTISRCVDLRAFGMLMNANFDIIV